VDGAAWVDGRVLPLAQATLPVTDRGFLLGDAVFETLRTRSGRPFLVGDHLDRLRRSAAAVALPVPWPDAELLSIIDELLPGRPESDAVIRLTVTRGDGGHGLALPEPVRPRLVVIRRPLPELSVARERGVAVVRDPRPVGRDPTLPPEVKTGNYLGAVTAIGAARRAGAVEALVRGVGGGWIEGTTSNLFVVGEGALLAPGPEAGALPGITRALVLALADRAGVPVHERAVEEEELERADELFVTSTVKGILPVVQLDARVVGEGTPGARTRSLRAAFDAAAAAIVRAGASRLREARLDP